MGRALVAVAVAGTCACAPAMAQGDWQVTSGTVSQDGGDNYTDSSVFRMVSADRGYSNVTVSMRLRVDDLHNGPDWSGAHVWVGYQSEYALYAVSVDREDDTMVIKKKCPGGPDNGGTYYDLTPLVPAPIPFGKWQNVSVTVHNSSDGVHISASRDGHSISAVDHGVGCAPLRSGGVGLRSDNAEIRFSNIAVG